MPVKALGLDSGDLVEVAEKLDRHPIIIPLKRGFLEVGEGKMFDLIYSGNMDLAWKLCDLSWPANHSGKVIFMKEFKEQLATSPYYGDIERLNTVHKD